MKFSFLFILAGTAQGFSVVAEAQNDWNSVMNTVSSLESTTFTNADLVAEVSKLCKIYDDLEDLVWNRLSKIAVPPSKSSREWETFAKSFDHTVQLLHEELSLLNRIKAHPGPAMRAILNNLTTDKLDGVSAKEEEMKKTHERFREIIWAGRRVIFLLRARLLIIHH